MCQYACILLPLSNQITLGLLMCTLCTLFARRRWCFFFFRTRQRCACHFLFSSPNDNDRRIFVVTFLATTRAAVRHNNMPSGQTQSRQWITFAWFVVYASAWLLFCCATSISSAVCWILLLLPLTGLPIQ